MQCSFEALRNKEVIDIENGERLGFVDDVEINLSTAEVNAFIIFGREKLFGLLGHEENIVIPCQAIKVVGSDVILIARDKKYSSFDIKSGKKRFESLSEK